MHPLFVIATTVTLILLPLSFYLFATLKNVQRKSKLLEIQLATATAQAQALEKEADEVRELRQANNLYLEEKSIAVTQRRELERKLEGVVGERDGFLREKEDAVASRQEAIKQVELMQQKMGDMQLRMKDWESQREEALKAAKASILEAGGQMSNKLLEDHKRESETAKKEAEEVAKKTTESLLQQVKTITESVASLKDQTHENRDKMSMVWRALSNPGAAGQLAEVGLENTLKNLRLEPGRDFFMQYSISSTADNATMRPDAVLFLPQDIVMVIDSKATKYSLDIAQAIGTPEETAALENLKKTMNTHLKALYSKDYAAAINAAYKESGRSSKIRMTIMVMYVPSESLIETIKRADPEFISKVERSGLILAGPASLSGLISLAGLNIGLSRQAENQDEIVSGVQDLMDNVITVLSYAERVGKGIKTAADSFEQFARSVNSRMLPKLKGLVRLGVKPAKNKELPGRITSYDVRAADDSMITIDGDVEGVEDYSSVSAIEDYTPKKKIPA